MHQLTLEFFALATDYTNFSQATGPDVYVLAGPMTGQDCINLITEIFTNGFASQTVTPAEHTQLSCEIAD